MVMETDVEKFRASKRGVEREGAAKKELIEREREREIRR